MATTPSVQEALLKEKAMVDAGDMAGAAAYSRARIAAANAQQNQPAPVKATAPTPVPATSTLNVGSNAPVAPAKAPWEAAPVVSGTTPGTSAIITDPTTGKTKTAPVSPSTTAALATSFTPSGNDSVDAINSLSDPSQSAEALALNEKRKALSDQLINGTLNDAEKQQVAAAAAAAGAEYDALIAKAEEQKAQGMPRALVSAGQIGGLMNTQFAGNAALGATTGGTFVGAGGELSRIQSEYDANISDLQRRKNAAIEAAKAAAMAAVTDKKESTLARADALYQEAVKAADAHNQLIISKVSAIDALSAKAKEVAKSTLSDYASAGMTSKTMDPTTLALMDQKMGYAAGTSAKLLDVAAKEKSVADEKTALDTYNSLYSVLDKIPSGQSISFGGNTYFGTNNPNERVTTEVDQATGDIVTVFHNKNTDAITTTRTKGVLTPNVNYSVQSITNKDGSQSLWYVDPTGKTPAKPVVGQQIGGAQGVSIGVMQQEIPSGTTYAEYKKDHPEATESDFWCLRWAANHDERGDALINEIGDSLQSKAASVEPDIGFGSGQRAPQVGDYILTNEDARYGHIAIIGDIRTDPNSGKQVAVLAESNYKPLTATYERTIPLDPTNLAVSGGKILGFKHSEMKSQYTSQPGGEQLTSAAPDATKPIQTADIVKTAEAKKLSGIVTLNQAIADYKALIEKNGASSGLTPTDRQNQQAAQQRIYAAFKDAEGLGALQAPDIELAKRLFPDVTEEGFFKALAPNPFKAGRAIKTLDETVAAYKVKAKNLYDQLAAQGEGVASDPYVQELAKQLKLGADETIHVRRKSDGMTGSISASEFNPEEYEKVD